MSGVTLATRGMIQGCCKQGQIISYVKPDVQATLEVRPRIRRAAAPPVVTVTTPVTLSAQELRPVVRVKTPAPVSPDPRPTQTSTQLLRPIIKKVEEE